MNINNKAKNNNSQIQRIAEILMYAYRINPNAFVSKNEFVKKVTYQEEAEAWVRNSLLNLDERLADCVLPILVDRFEQHLQNWNNPNGR